MLYPIVQFIRFNRAFFIFIYGTFSAGNTAMDHFMTDMEYLELYTSGFKFITDHA